MNTDKNLLNYNTDDIKELMVQLDEKPFRGNQLYEWMSKGITDYSKMNNLPKSLFEKLSTNGFYIGMPEVLRSQESKDGTVKCLFKFRGVKSGASVDMEYESDEAGDVGEASEMRIESGASVDMEIESGEAGEMRVESGDTGEAGESLTVLNDNDSVVDDTDSETLGKSSSYVESVFMKYSYGNSICISSQVGCRMGCTFCASTMDGLERNLTGGEMLAEVLAMRNLTGEDIGHVVVMGMGEPFDNYEELSKFIRLIHDPKGYNLGLRNITVSTCGIIPGIKRFAEDFPQVNLAVSLHAPNQEMREKIMPVAKKYRYDELMQACREYTEKTSRRITFEYALIDGVNDGAECAEELASNLKGMLAHVNLIPLNEVKGREYKKARADNVKRFKELLEKRGVAVTVRRTLGSDIDAACGQLRRNITE